MWQIIVVEQTGRFISHRVMWQIMLKDTGKKSDFFADESTKMSRFFLG